MYLYTNKQTFALVVHWFVIAAALQTYLYANTVAESQRSSSNAKSSNAKSSSPNADVDPDYDSSDELRDRLVSSKSLVKSVVKSVVKERECKRRPPQLRLER
jgi:hypothetical protein